MSDVRWLDRRPGETVAQVDAEHDGDGKALVVGTDRPDWVRLPENLGGARVRVRETTTARCPVHDHGCLTHHLENGISVAECDQFYWYRAS